MSKEQQSGERRLELGTLGWLVRYQWLPHWMDFQAYEVVAQDIGGTTSYYRRRGAKSGGDWTEDPAEAAALTGYVKWDGCCHFNWREPGEHFCGVDDVEAFAKVLVAIHNIAAEVLPNFDRVCAGYPAKGGA